MTNGQAALARVYKMSPTMQNCLFLVGLTFRYRQVEGSLAKAKIVGLTPKSSPALRQLRNEIDSLFCQLSPDAQQAYIANKEGRIDEWRQWWWKHMNENPKDFWLLYNHYCKGSIWWALVRKGFFRRIERLMKDNMQWQEARADFDLKALDRILLEDIRFSFKIKKIAKDKMKVRAQIK